MSQTTPENERTRRDVDELLADIITDAHGDDEQLWAFRKAFEEAGLPASGFALGDLVSVLAIEYDGNVRLGLRARCRREDGSTFVIGVADLRFAAAAGAVQHLAAFQQWMGLDVPPMESPPAASVRRSEAGDDHIDLSGPVELVVLAVRERTARCRILDSEHAITLRAGDLWNVVPGQVLTVQPRKQWRYGGHPYLSGEIQDARIDIAALGLVPLQLHEYGEWDPANHYWGDDGDALEAWATPIAAAGPRAQFEMEQILPGDDPSDRDGDPILMANELARGGDMEGARKILMDMLQSDLRSLDAHAHLGNLVFESAPHKAIVHYEVGFRIGECSLGEQFNGVLPWGLIDNRPFLRCMHSFALCLWRLDSHGEAAKLFERMLWLNPTDNQGCRDLVHAARAGERWSS